MTTAVYGCLLIIRVLRLTLYVAQEESLRLDHPSAAGNVRRRSRGILRRVFVRRRTLSLGACLEEVAAAHLHFTHTFSRCRSPSTVPRRHCRSTSAYLTCMPTNSKHPVRESAMEVRGTRRKGTRHNGPVRGFSQTDRSGLQ